MKNWILGIFRLGRQMYRACNVIDGQVERLSLNLTESTLKLVNTIIALQDRKVRLVNFYVLYKKMKTVLNAEEREFITRHAKGEALFDIGASLGVSKVTAWRRIQKAVEKCAAVASDLSFTEARFLLHYRDIPLIYHAVKELQRCDARRFEPLPLSVPSAPPRFAEAAV